jgi:ATP-binding cassette, subfamily B, bacterial PglK
VSLLTDLWRLLDRPQKLRLLALLAFGILMGIATLAGIAAVVPFFAVLGDPGYIRGSAALSWLYQHGGFASDGSFMVALGVSFLALVLLANAINLLGSLAMFRFAHRTGDRLCVALFREYIQREHQFHLASNSATLFNNIIWEVSRGITGVLQAMFSLSTNAVTSALILGSVVILNPLIALTAVAALAGSYGLIYLFARQRLLRNGLRESQHAEERTRTVNETLGAIREISLVSGQDFFAAKFAKSCAAISRSAINTQAISQSPRHILECIVVAGLVAVSLVLIDRADRGGPWLAQLSYLGFAAYRLLPALQQMFHAIVKIRGDRVAFNRIADDLRRAVAGKAVAGAGAAGTGAGAAGAGAGAAGAGTGAAGTGAGAAGAGTVATGAFWQGRPHQQIELRQVAFHYSAGAPPAIRELSLEIPAGATVGLLGPSGSGKTTLAELLIGLLTPTAGVIAVDGMVIDESNRKAWQSTIAYVPQHVFLLDSSLAENIALATPPGEIDVERMIEAARLAQLDAFVRTLPRGYQEKLGERGVRLSGGQRQRVGIARALYRSASVLVLDEATNALDGLTESEIMSTLEALRGERTIILIAHRLSAMHRFDLVLEVTNGSVALSRAHGQLLRKPA